MKKTLIIGAWALSILIAIGATFYLRGEKEAPAPSPPAAQEAPTVKVVVETPPPPPVPPVKVQERSRPPLTYYHGEWVYHVNELSAGSAGTNIPIYARIANAHNQDSSLAYDMVDVDTGRSINAAIGDGDIYDNPDREKLLREASRTGEAIYLYGYIVVNDRGGISFVTKRVFRKEEVIN